MNDVQELAGRHMALIGAAVVALVAVPIGLWKGGPAVVLWIGFALLLGAVLLFWETLRLVLDPSQPGDVDEGDDDGAALNALEARKRDALKALQDLEFERSIGRIGDEDHAVLEARYREEARAAMRAIDEGVGPWRARAEAMLAGAEPSPPSPLSPTGRGGAEAKTETATMKAEVAVAAAPPAPPRPVGERGLGGEGPTCPKCATINDSDAVFCKRCGQRVKEDANATA